VINDHFSLYPKKSGLLLKIEFFSLLFSLPFTTLKHMPTLGSIVSIHTFDDGNQKYTSEPNVWEVLGLRNGGGKYELRNVRSGTIISSISAWKVQSV
jgi:hypothetical protein